MAAVRDEQVKLVAQLLHCVTALRVTNSPSPALHFLRSIPTCNRKVKHMSSTDHAIAMFVTHKAVAMLTELHPGLTLEKAAPALTALIWEAQSQATGGGTTIQMASAAYNAENVQQHIPPWTT